MLVEGQKICYQLPRTQTQELWAQGRLTSVAKNGLLLHDLKGFPIMACLRPNFSPVGRQEMTHYYS